MEKEMEKVAMYGTRALWVACDPSSRGGSSTTAEGLTSSVERELEIGLRNVRENEINLRWRKVSWVAGFC
jgi:hypothetical protein